MPTQVSALYEFKFDPKSRLWAAERRSATSETQARDRLIPCLVGE